MRTVTWAIGLILVAGAVQVEASEVQGWRTDGTGRYPTASPPIRWSAVKNVHWATPMPDWSNSTPVITGRRLLVCAEQATLICMDLGDGKILWQRPNGLDQLDPPATTGMPGSHGTNGYSSPTPLTDGRNVFVLFGNGVAAAYDLEGNRHWITRVGVPNHAWGHSSSPALASGIAAFLVHDLVGLDVVTGQEKWRVPSQSCWGSPVTSNIGDVPVFVTPNGRIIRASDGHVLYRDLASLAYSSPAVVDGVVYFIEEKSMAYRLPGSTTTAPQHLWTQRLKGSRHYASPLVHDGLIYAISREQKLTVLEADTGTKVYEKKFDLGGGVNSVYSSPTLGGRHIFIGFESGTTIVIEPGERYREVARNELEKYRSSPVFRSGKMYLRTMGHLYCIARSEPVVSLIFR